ncbi:MAG: polymer-forming cytoskeletal protein [Hyphomicrobiaceae bacterium]|nr:MAG: polymer-forming cytoskeletal protein [Hyphomicrobiaceae bacterium]
MFTRNPTSNKPGDNRSMSPLQVTPMPPINRSNFATPNPVTSSAPPLPVEGRSQMVNLTSALNGSSVIGSDLTILGRDITIISKGTLQIDGEVQGNLHGKEIIVGDNAKVSGTVTAESVIVQGHVKGIVKGLKVALKGHALVDGEIHHHTLSIEEGATFEGRVRRPKDASELTPTLDPNLIANGDQGVETAA